MLGVVATAAVAAAGWLLWSTAQTRPTIDGVEHGALLSAEEAGSTTIVISPVDDPDDLAVTFNSEPVTTGTTANGVWEWELPSDLGDGTHVINAELARRSPFPNATTELAFTVDRTAPDLAEPTVSAPMTPDEPVSITGRTEPGASVRAGGAQATADAEGAYALTLDAGESGPVEVVASDAAGNEAVTSVLVVVGYPQSAGVHVTGAAWQYEPLRREILALIDDGRINAVELDLKDEAGVVNYDTSVQLAHDIGAVHDYFDLAATIAELHERGVRVIGRMVAYRDPILAEAAWEQGNKDWVLQDASGAPLGAYGGFTNFAHPDVRGYNLALALEAADAGIDDILWDYIRRPEGDLDSMVIPGMSGSVSDAVTQLLAEAKGPLHERGVFQGASVFGVAASRPDDIAQHIPTMAPHLDYVAPMVYPSHWNPGEYDVENPNAQPYDIVRASLADFQQILEGTGTALVPWLQDFSLGVDYGPAEVRAQIEAAESLGIDSFLLWDPAVTYTPEGLDR